MTGDSTDPRGRSIDGLGPFLRNGELAHAHKRGQKSVEQWPRQIEALPKFSAADPVRPGLRDHEGESVGVG